MPVLYAFKVHVTEYVSLYHQREQRPVSDLTCLASSSGTDPVGRH